MLKLQRDFTKSFTYEKLLCGESISVFQLGERKRKKTVIFELENEEGQALRGVEIEQHVYSFFKQLYEKAETNLQENNFDCERILSEDDEANSALMSAITTQDIYVAIKTACANKSPGEDGLPKEFYMRAFDVIHRELNLIINEAMVIDLPSEFTRGTIVLVKKKDGDNTVKGYRPISLLNFDFKILGRILKRRLEHVLRERRVLSDAQKCSNPGHSIFEATLTLRDRIAEMITRQQQGKLISYDLDHAFDRVSHDFLYRTLLSMGFNPAVVALIKRINVSSSSRMLINGHLSQSFPIERSVRQGDPLSMVLFVIYLHPFLMRLERICRGDVCVAYADDISVITTDTEQTERMRELFALFEIAAGAKLNLQKTIAIDVGFNGGNPLIVPWLQTQRQVKILGVIFTNSFKEMIKLNWDSLVTKFAQQVWLHSRRTLNLLQKVILLNTFISSKMWYVASIIPPLNLHTAKITSSMGRFLWHHLPARVPILQLARSREDGGLNLQLPAFKCKALIINRYMKEFLHMPFTETLITHGSPLPSHFPCLKMIQQQYSSLPPHLRVNLTSKTINNFFTNRTERPRVERLQNSTNWKRIWRNISDKRLSSDTRTVLYLFVNEKIENRRLLHTMQRVNNAVCLRCNVATETIKHKYSECSRVVSAWDFIQQRMRSVTGAWSRLSFEEIIRPELNNLRFDKRYEILRMIVAYLNFIDKSNGNIDVNGLAFSIDTM